MTEKPSLQKPIQVIPARPKNWPDIEAFFVRTPCWCQYWRVSASEYGRLRKGELHEERTAQHKQALRSQLELPIPPGMLAYIQDQMVGWCGFGPRQEMDRLVRSRTIPKVDDRPVWAIFCFLVRVGYRRRGVARALLQGLVQYARDQGVQTLEAYPIDPGEKRVDVTSAYVGTMGMFEEAGFQRVVETSAHSAGLPRWVVRLELG
jgi:GNAT superfamily N-acetyltransferase